MAPFVSATTEVSSPPASVILIVQARTASPGWDDDFSILIPVICAWDKLTLASASASSLATIDQSASLTLNGAGAWVCVNLCVIGGEAMGGKPLRQPFKSQVKLATWANPPPSLP